MQTKASILILEMCDISNKYIISYDICSLVRNPTELLRIIFILHLYNQFFI